MSLSTDETIEYIKKQSPQSYAKIDAFLTSNKLSLFLITKKLVGKSTYIKYINLLYPNRFEHIPVGDVVRNAQKELGGVSTSHGSSIESGATDNRHSENELIQDTQKTLKANGSIGSFTTAEAVIDSIRQSTVGKLLPTSVMEFLLQREINKVSELKSVIFDGVPRSLDQIDFVKGLEETLTEKGYKILFLEIDLNDKILDDRLTARVVCPSCGLVSSILTVHAGEPRYDKEKNEFYLVCDSPTCKDKEVRLEPKQGESSYEDMIGRRRKEEEVNKAMREASPNNYVYLRSDIPVKEFIRRRDSRLRGNDMLEGSGMTGGNEELELNMVTKFRPGEHNEITREQEPQIGYIEGEPAYSYAPAGMMPVMLEKVSNKLPG